MYHLPVLLNESISLLNIDPQGVYVDLTYGGGGHSRAILESLTTGKLVAFDQDEDAHKNAISDDRFVFIPQNFRYLSNFLKFYKLHPVDGILADLGVSSFQIDEPSKGFSYMNPDSDLNMRMSNKLTKTAADVLNSYSEKELSDLFFEFSELQYSRKLAASIVASRKEGSFAKTSDLTGLVDRFVSPNHRFGNYSRVFQALRIEVNDEMDALREMLMQTLEVLKPGGVLVVISYHSAEDRIVKNFMKFGNVDGVPEKDFYGCMAKYFDPITKKPIVPGDEEISRNNRARSAKLRASRRLA
jgi:16S rRNA (cytosine1402-N4)-methyltransferase